MIAIGVAVAVAVADAGAGAGVNAVVVADSAADNAREAVDTERPVDAIARGLQPEVDPGEGRVTDRSRTHRLCCRGDRIDRRR